MIARTAYRFSLWFARCTLAVAVACSVAEAAALIDQRIRETTEYASVLFYIDIHSRDTGTIFYSSNRKGRSVPDIKVARRYDVDWDVGPLRVGEFIMAPYDVVIATPEA